MGCANDTEIPVIKIPVIAISKSGGEELNRSMTDGVKGKALLGVWLN